ncbi:MAG: hypothetical protein Q9222_004500 [Ikaeria aurantiellina]
MAPTSVALKRATAMTIGELMEKAHLSAADVVKAMDGKYTETEVEKAMSMQVPDSIIQKLPFGDDGGRPVQRMVERATEGAAKTSGGGKWGSAGMYAVVALIIAAVVLTVFVIGYKMVQRRKQKKKQAAAVSQNQGEGENLERFMNNTAANDFAKVNKREVADGMGGL